MTHHSDLVSALRDKALSDLSAENERLRQQNASLNEKYQAHLHVEITGLNHQPLYSYGYLNECTKVDRPSNNPSVKMLNVILEKINPFPLDSYDIAEVWIGGSLRGRFYSGDEMQTDLRPFPSIVFSFPF